MKIKSLTLQHYKKFTALKTISFCNPEGDVNDITLLLGQNGSGKSSLSQAITALVATATRAKFSPESLDWAGYDYKHLQTGAFPPRIEAQMLFSEQERTATQEFAKQLQDKGIRIGNPSNMSEITLSLDYIQKKVKTNGGKNAAFQFNGCYIYRSKNKLK